MIYVVEVQHSSDDNRDGVWYELDRGPRDYIFGRGGRLETLKIGYHVRPVRARSISDAR